MDKGKCWAKDIDKCHLKGGGGGRRVEKNNGQEILSEGKGKKRGRKREDVRKCNVID
jgi:hypothetical protein